MLRAALARLIVSIRARLVSARCGRPEAGTFAGLAPQVEALIASAPRPASQGSTRPLRTGASGGPDLAAAA